MMTRRIVLLALMILVGASRSLAQSDKPFEVLIATWRGCEEACQGVTDYLLSLEPEIVVRYRDAERERARVRDILNEARRAKVDLIVSWGTSVTLEMAGTLATLDDPAFNHDIPQVFMIVADPVGAGIVEDLDATGRKNLTGTYNRVPEKVNVDTLRRLLPEIDTLGLLYNENEKNSVVKRDELAELLPGMSVALVDLAIELGPDGSPMPEDIGPAVRRLKNSGADAMYVGSSSFLRSNAAVLGAAARGAGLPLISPYEEMVRDGNALISVAARYYDIGQLAGRQAEAILVGGSEAGDLPVARMQNFALTVNLDFAKEVGVWPPIDLLEFADIVK